jgi:cleavage stimulation factor subunit 3
MADYDTADTPQYGEPTADYQYPPMGTGDDEDDDYDPSAMEDSEGDVTAQQPPASNALPLKPKTVGGFMVDDDEEEEEQDTTVSQLNGAQAGSADENTVVASEPSQEVPSAPSNAPVNGSSSVHLPASLPDNTLPANPNAPSLQSPTDQGKQQLSTTASAMQSTTATPQPPSSTAPLPNQQNGQVPPTPTVQRLPHDKVGQLEDRIKEDPKADTEAWRELIKHYREKGQLDNARRVYTRFFEVFPSAVSSPSN